MSTCFARNLEMDRVKFDTGGMMWYIISTKSLAHSVQYHSPAIVALPLFGKWPNTGRISPPVIRGRGRFCRWVMDNLGQSVWRKNGVTF